MIEICKEFASVGRNLGNKLFTYAVARIISETHNLNVRVPSQSYIQRSGDVIPFPFGDILNKRDITSPSVYVCDRLISDNGWDYVINKCKDSHVALDGYFLKYDYIKNYKQFIKDMYATLATPLIEDNSVVIMLRDSNADSTFKLPKEFYLDILNKNNFSKVYISYDHYHKHSSLIEEIQLKFNTKLLDLNIIDLMREITSCENIIAAQGTFSFWGAFLSSAKKIYWPITKIGPNRPDEWCINLQVDDEDRYEFINI